MIGSSRSVFLSPADTVTLPNPIAAYSFNEGSGSTAADSSSNGYDATLGSGGTWDPSGHSGAGLSNTTATIGALASVATSTSTAATLMGWVKPLDLTTGSNHVAFGFFSGGGNNTELAFYPQRSDFGSPNVLQFDIRISGSLYPITNSTALTVGVWSHLALTFDGSTTILYLDGSPISTLSQSGTINPGFTLGIAGHTIDSGYDSDVVVDDIRYYGVALTEEQVVKAMNTAV